jgi:hypothetical protein
LTASEAVQNRLRIAGLETAATYEQLAKAFNQAYVPALDAAFDEKQVVDFTVAITQAATAMRVPLDLLGEEVRSILTGQMQPRNTILKPLMDAAGLTNEKIRQLSDSGKLYGAVMEALKGASLGASEAAGNFTVRLSNLKDAVSQVLGKGLDEGFRKTKALIQELTEWTGNSTRKPERSSGMKTWFPPSGSWTVPFSRLSGGSRTCRNPSGILPNNIQSSRKWLSNSPSWPP